MKRWLPGRACNGPTGRSEYGVKTVLLDRFSSRSYYLSTPTVVDSLRRHRQAQVEERLELGPVFQDHGLVFCQQDGRPIDPSNFRRAWRKIVQAADIGHVRFHDLRHGHATQLLMAGVHAKIVSERLGHSTISITMDTYSHVLPGLQDEAVAKLDQWLSDTGVGLRSRK